LPHCLHGPQAAADEIGLAGRSRKTATSVFNRDLIASLFELSSLPPIRFINLDRDTERRHRLTVELERQGVAGERWPAVLWTALSSAEQSALYCDDLNRRQFYKPLVNGEKGCYASHIALWRWLLDSPHATLAVLEDDVRLEAGFTDVCAAVTALPESRWDMVKLIGRTSLGKPEKLQQRQPLCAGFDLLRYRRVPSLTAGYVINRQGATKLLASRLPFGRPIDVDLRHWWECRSLQVLGVEPSVVSLDETSLNSSIGDRTLEASMLHKWRKFHHKLRYTLGNAWHAR
jgi:glycosyl transferase, family 25